MPPSSSLGISGADVDADVFDDLFSLLDIFAEIIPYVMFFQHTFSIRRACYANFIIDDPCLWKRYGFVDYREVLDLACKWNFAVTIAFIPWNHRRSNSATVKLFAADQDRLSICVHGCDHTAGEFATMDKRVLDWKAALAVKRMEEHQRRFGLPYDDLMVFPQGAFSEEAMNILQENGFTAAVNSDVLACNYRGGFKVRDLMAPFTTCYGLPLFRRRYPKRIEDFAIDLLFGRPALIVQHNADFADGWDRAVSFINQLNGLEPDLQWMPLGRVVEKMSPIGQATVRDETTLNAWHGYTVKSYLKTALRRACCDIRDNYICKSRILRSFIPGI